VRAGTGVVAPEVLLLPGSDSTKQENVCRACWRCAMPHRAAGTAVGFVATVYICVLTNEYMQVNAAVCCAWPGLLAFSAFCYVKASAANPTHEACHMAAAIWQRTCMSTDPLCNICATVLVLARAFLHVNSV
jgi:hypothetical protein